MKLHYLILLLIVSSCAATRIKKVPVEVVTISSVEKEEIKVRELTVPTIHVQANQPVLATIDENPLGGSESLFSGQYENLIIESSDEEPGDNEKIISAVHAEHAAHSSNKELTGALISSLVSWLFPPLLIGSIILIIIGSVHFSKANNARYITVDGEKYLNRARRMLWASTIVTGLMILGIAFVLLLFLI